MHRLGTQLFLPKSKASPVGSVSWSLMCMHTCYLFAKTPLLLYGWWPDSRLLPPTYCFLSHFYFQWDLARWSRGLYGCIGQGSTPMKLLLNVVTDVCIWLKYCRFLVLIQTKHKKWGQASSSSLPLSLRTLLSEESWVRQRLALLTTLLVPHSKKKSLRTAGPAKSWFPPSWLSWLSLC